MVLTTPLTPIHLLLLYRFVLDPISISRIVIGQLRCIALYNGRPSRRTETTLWSLPLPMVVDSSLTLPWSLSINSFSTLRWPLLLVSRREKLGSYLPLPFPTFLRRWPLVPS